MRFMLPWPAVLRVLRTIPLPLHPHRADVLAACALVARSRLPLADGLERLATDDPLLARWARRLSPALRAGDSLPQTLRAARLVTRSEAEQLDLETDVVAGLDRVASTAATGPRWIPVVRHLPSALAVGMGVPAAVAAMVVAAAGFTDRVASDIGFAGSAMSPLRALGTLGLLILGMAIAEWLLRSIRGLRHLATLWSPGVERELALLGLLHAARTGHCPRPPLHALRLGLGVFGLAAQRLGRPGWDREWRTWMFLAGWRIPRAQRREVRHEPDLATRMTRLGLVDLVDGQPDWLGAEARCRLRLASAVEDAIVVARPLLLLAVWIGVVLAVASVWMPFLTALRYSGLL